MRGRRPPHLAARRYDIGRPPTSRARIPNLTRVATTAARTSARDADAAIAVAAHTRRPRTRLCAKEGLSGAAGIATVATFDEDRAARADCDLACINCERAAARASASCLVIASGVAALAAREVNRALEIDR